MGSGRSTTSMYWILVNPIRPTATKVIDFKSKVEGKPEYEFDDATILRIEVDTSAVADT